MIGRGIFIALAAASTMASHVRAQSSAATAGAIAIGYGVLSVGAIVTMASMPSEAAAEPGRTIRARGSAGGFRLGRVLAVTDGRLAVETDADTTIISTDSLAELEVSLGNRGRWAQGWGIGFLAGAGVGGLIGLASGDDPPGTFIRLNAEQKALVAGSVLAVGGSVVGTLIGLAGPERWVHATRPSETSRVSITPIAGSRIGVSARIAF